MSVLPTLYEFYTNGGISSGLTYDSQQFYLNKIPITLYSGSVHYYRIPPEYWKRTLRQARSAGLNAIETYVPWNLHELNKGEFDFGNGTNDMSKFLHLENFLNFAKEEDLFVILRPGPYICTEWDFGGLPSWLLKYRNIKVRTTDSTYMKFVEKYFHVLFSILTLYQFTNNGSIIAYQVENEYGSFGKNYIQTDYLKELKSIMIKNGANELFLTSDGATNLKYFTSMNDNLKTVNFGPGYAKKNLDTLKSFQSEKPFMVMEFWIGWFNHWGDPQKVNVPDNQVAKTLKEILDYPSSVNLYMFYGGTSWGFLNGANINNKNEYQPDITSYDYDAAISENGNYTTKYEVITEIIAENNKIKTKLPEKPVIYSLKTYDTLTVDSYIELYSVINDVISESNFRNKKVNSMERFGQKFGYIVYRKSKLIIPKKSILKIEGNIHDTVLVLINGVLINDNPLSKVSDLNNFGYWKMKNSALNLNNSEQLENATLDLVIENFGRVNFGYLPQFDQRKGLLKDQNVYLNNILINKWDIGNLEFDKAFQEKYLTNFGSEKGKKSPIFSKFLLNISENSTLSDTYIDMTRWNKGFVIVNNFLLGRHCILGPQLSLYLPGPFLKHGINEIIVFDHFQRNITQLKFSSVQI